MKIKQHIHISNKKAFLRGDYDWCFSTVGHISDGDWIHCGEVEFEINVDTQTIIDSAAKEIDDEIGKHTAAINVLEARKAELLALPSPAEDV